MNNTKDQPSVLADINNAEETSQQESVKKILYAFYVIV